MMQPENSGLPRPGRTVMMNTCGAMASLVLCLAAQCALAQQQAEPQHDELDVTMQIIVDPDAKLSDEVVRRIPLPARKPADPSASSAAKDAAKQNAATRAQERAREAQGLGREMSERAKERAQDAAEQREQAQRSRAEERRRNPGPPDHPGPPATPPGR